MSKTLVCTNILDSMSSEVYGNHCQQWYQLGRSTTDDFILFHPYRMTIDNARNSAAQIAMRNECDYIWFLDSDMILAPKTYHSLKSRNADICMAHTYIRGEPFNEMFFVWENIEDRRNLTYYKNWRDHINNDGTINVDAVGFACTLLKVNRLLEMRPPYFITASQQTEDIYYCIKLRDHDKDSTIKVDCSVPTGHLLNPEAISLHNVDKMREFYKEYSHNRINNEKDRGKEYLESCKKLLI